MSESNTAVGISTDGSKQPFLRIGNIRVTFVAAVERPEARNWADTDVLRVQAYRDSESDALHKGAEFPVDTPEAMFELISGLCTVYNEGRRRARGKG